MDKRIYFAVFEPDDESEGYTVTFPDLPGCITEGDSFEEAAANAREALELHLWGMEQDGDEIPTPSKPESITTPPGAFLVPIEAWMDLVRNEMAQQSVNTMVTMPRWLKEAAQKAGINFSQLLQEVVKERLGILGPR